MQHYKGALFPDVCLPMSMRKLEVMVKNAEVYETLHQYLLRKKDLELLGINMPPDIEVNSLQPIPISNPSTAIEYYICDITYENSKNAAKMLLRLQPTSEHIRFQKVFFPRLIKSVDLMRTLILDLKGAKIEKEMAFPSKTQPDSKEDKDGIEELALREIGVSIDWNKELDTWSRKDE